MDNQTYAKIKDLLSQHSQVGVIIGKNPGIDEAAAGLSLYLAALQMGKQVIVASATPPTVEISNLVGIDKVKNTLGGTGGDLTVSFPYKEGEIEKVSYTLENGYLNIVVKAGDKGLSFQDQAVQFKRGGGKIPSLMFFVGVPRLTDLGNLFNAETFKDTTIVNIDNKPDNQGYGDVLLVSPRFSSISEQIANLLLEIDREVSIDQDIAQNLLSGIAQATNDFQDPKTSYLAFEMAGILMRKGATRRSMQPRQERREQNASFFPYQPQQSAQQVSQSMGGQGQPRPQQFPRQQFPRPFQQQQYQQPYQQQAPRASQQQYPQQPMGNQQRPMQQQSQQHMQPTSGQHQNQNQQNNTARSMDNNRQDGQQQPQQPSQQQQQSQTPPDWLTPKVYKGSTVL